jgi:putative membrane protein
MRWIVIAVGVIIGGPVLFAQAVTDAQIAAIVVTANQIDIDAGKLAAEKATNEAVRKFGQLMVTDHAGVNKSAADLAARLKVVPQQNATSDSLKKAAAAHVEKLKGLSGAAFDRAYIDHEVAYHQQVLDVLDRTLIPSASHPELKELLVKVRPAFVAHLEHARSVQKTTARNE